VDNDLTGVLGIVDGFVRKLDQQRVNVFAIPDPFHGGSSFQGKPLLPVFRFPALLYPFLRY
jgi:hypothetical protein